MIILIIMITIIIIILITIITIKTTTTRMIIGIPIHKSKLAHKDSHRELQPTVERGREGESVEPIQDEETV